MIFFFFFYGQTVPLNTLNALEFLGLGELYSAL